jgi:hypothetical protein
MNPEPQKNTNISAAPSTNTLGSWKKEKEEKYRERGMIFFVYNVCVYIYIYLSMLANFGPAQPSQSQPPPRPAIGWRPAGRPELRKVGALRGENYGLRP